MNLPMRRSKVKICGFSRNRENKRGLRTIDGKARRELPPPRLKEMRRGVAFAGQHRQDRENRPDRNIRVDIG